MKRVIVITAIVIVVVVIVGYVGLYVKLSNYRTQFIHSQDLLLTLQEEIGKLRDDKGQLLKKNESLEANITSYVALNSKLQAEVQKFTQALEEAQTIIERKEAALQRQVKEWEELEEAFLKEGGKELGNLAERYQNVQKEREAYRAQLSEQQKNCHAEQALCYYNLGVAYTQTQHYNEALDAYGRSLSFNPNNPEAHYNLGLIYDNIIHDSQKAIFHYRKYLSLAPESLDRQEVQGWIERLM
jgi:tetratricopeptide (TPR) repeat protein